MNKKVIVVLGGFGFLGSAVIRTFLKLPEWNIFILDKPKKGCTLPYFISNQKITHINSTINGIRDIPKQLPLEFDVMINCTEIYDEADCIDSSINYISIEDIKVDSEIYEKENAILKNILLVNEQINIKNIIFPIPYTGSVTDRIIKNIKKLFCNQQHTIIHSPLLFGIFDKISKFLPSLILSYLLDKKVIITSYNDTGYEWLYVDDAAIQIRTIICEENIGDFQLKGDKYSAREINELLIKLIDTKNNNLTLKPVDKDSIREQTKYRWSCIFKKYELERYEDIKERLIQTIEFYEDNIIYYKNHLKYLEREKNVN